MAASASEAAAERQKNDSGVGSAAITFRVRCETLGHGESVYLVPSGDVNQLRGIPLYTTPSSFPWYTVQDPVLVHLDPTKFSANKDSAADFFSYRFSIYRGGAFHRFETVSDGPSDEELFHHHNREAVSSGDDDRSDHLEHKLPLRLLSADENYIVNDVLGVTLGNPDIEHITVARSLGLGADGMLNRSTHASRANLASQPGSTSNLSNTHQQADSKKKVNFAPSSVPHRPSALSPATQPVNLCSTDGLVVASVFLPVHLHRSDDGEWTAHWDYEALLSMDTHMRVTRVGTVKWRGWHGNYGQDGSPMTGVPVEERGKVETCLRPFNCVPVWIDTRLFGEMYNGFCKGVLWSVFHNVTSVYSAMPQGGLAKPPEGPPAPEEKFEVDHDDHNAANLSEVSNQLFELMQDDIATGPIHGDGGKEASLWAAYTAVNRLFADAIIQCFNQGDMVWVHGFHLLILPSYLIRRIPMAKIGLFLHTPFPSSEIFRTLWCREDLLRGMLNADQVGFHLFEYARHFLTCCRRLLGLTYGMIPDTHGGYNLTVETGGRNVMVTSIHAGVEPPIINQLLYHSVTVEKSHAIQRQFKGKTVFAAFDRLESLKGIPLHLLGLERFLTRCPEWVGKIVLLQVGISAFERGDDYTKTRTEVQQMVDNINSKWPGTVHFQECAESEMRLQQRMALLRASDVCLVTSLRDGLNRIPLEFTMAHLDAVTESGRKDGRQRGLCILSEFSSCTRVMRGALHVNPWKIAQIANAFHQALIMSQDERMRRINIASEFVTRVTTQRWALAVLLDLKSVQKNTDGQFSGAGLGLGYRILGMDSGFNSLDLSAVAKSYKKARHRLILLDYGGTIIHNDNLDNLKRYQMVNQLRAPSLPSDHTIEMLKELCADKKNHVFVVSGKERHSLVKALGRVPNLGLAAEHGMFISYPSKRSKRSWETIVPETDRSWRSLAITIMEVYTSRTHGSYIEETEMKVLWQYRDADPEFGYLQSRELEDHLVNVLRGYAVEVLHGGIEEGGYVEVRPLGVNKGVLALHVLQKLPKKIDFALCIGDDHCDEPMLSVMRQIGRRVVETKLLRQGKPPLPPLPATVTLVDVSSCDDHVSSNLEVFTATVGKKPSAAANYLNDVDEAYELLDILNKMNARDQRYFSSVDLRAMESKKGRFGAGPAQMSGGTGGGFSGLAMAVNTDATGTGGGTFKRSVSLGTMHREEKGVSASLQQFLGAIEDEEEEDAVFF